MGRLTREAIESTADLEYAGGFARRADAASKIYDDVARLIASEKPEVIVDFTPRPATQHVASTAVERGIAPVIGSSEWNAEEREELRALCASKKQGAILVPNFALGAVLMMRFAEEAAPFFPSVEIVEMHHADKRDKPSGTAAVTAERVRGAGGPAELPIHSVRMQGLLSHQEVLLGGPGELLTIRHDSLSLQSFTAGILMAIRNVRTFKELVVGLDVR